MGDRRVGFALSGGGHRAAVWGFGAIVGFLRAREHEVGKTPGAELPGDLPVVSVASVSGGSIANAAAACALDDLDRATSAALLDAARPVLHRIAHAGVLPGEGTRLYVGAAIGALLLAGLATLALLGAAAGLGHDWLRRENLWWPPVIGAVVGAVVLGRRAQLAGGGLGDLLRAAVVGLVGGALVGAVPAGGAWLAGPDGPSRPGRTTLLLAVATAVAWIVAARLLAARGWVVERTLRRVLVGAGLPEPVRLSDLAERSTNHVFCATELQTGRQAYLMPRRLYSWSLGSSGDTERVTVARAVQASAALPGGFPPQQTVLTRSGVSFSGGTFTPQRMVLVDGGVYDNLGDQWEAGFGNRAAQMPDIDEVQPDPATFLVVANAGRSLGTRPFGSASGLVAEVKGLLRDQQIQYDQTTAPRRRALVAEFRAAEAGAPGLLGVIVQASRSPWDLCTEIAGDEDEDADVRDRAAAWIAAFEEGKRDRAAWRELADANSGASTTLAAIGRDRTIDLLEHAVVLTQVTLHVRYGIGEVDLVDRAELVAALDPAPSEEG